MYSFPKLNNNHFWCLIDLFLCRLKDFSSTGELWTITVCSISLIWSIFFSRQIWITILLIDLFLINLIDFFLTKNFLLMLTQLIITNISLSVQLLIRQSYTKLSTFCYERLGWKKVKVAYLLVSKQSRIVVQSGTGTSDGQRNWLTHFRLYLLQVWFSQVWKAVQF